MTAEPLPEKQPARDGDRVLDGPVLKALAHPLRVQLLDILSQYGPQTASSMGKRVGESSGATSYHLRQLARHGLVREIENRGSGRERWWERPRGTLAVNTSSSEQDPAVREAARQVNRHFVQGRAEALAAFTSGSPSELPAEWADAAMLSTLNAQLTADQLRKFTREMEAILREKLEAYRSEPGTPGARPVQLHFNAFPLIDFQEQP
ncbi:helix-turn-helix domain-containing protein [Arthrobacter zhangbolii]|uniref:Helix-turn-helix domain-containing protein n=1 Tax=Arthrobacter zhangbolii TaxID=2886936 RepID=A0A9X1SAG7_9MICC|nr:MULTISPECIES: helix-turn-helix domain-containing protein [Arthrobacter]MCC3273536.1 helix-turn-helix domain-containing protein [Arthrobacter zhangbolii]MCC3295606.1 helix-turn-helix domain-containing protein [Arthrobacter zhangbolii]MDN3905819.1 helix-turn-helix domain-containing protein [Arthrobacter sp. YD2]UON92349.1 helix-turn-helix domain-containing protein [Arthrobacter zhangbolii]